MRLQLLQEMFVQQLIKTHQKNDFLAHLIPGRNLSPKQQLAIYQNNISSALQKTLAQIYPVCHRIVGEKYFKQMASYYIPEHPSQNHDLNSYGKDFADFVQTQCQQRNELYDFPYLSDLVRLEWYYHCIYYAAEGTLFDLSAFAQLSSAQQACCSFQLVPHLQFIASDYPILSIWRLNQQDENEQQIPHSNAESCCVFRVQNTLKIKKINPNVYQLLKSIEAGITLEKISQTFDAHYLPELIKANWIASFKVHHVQ